MFTKQVTLSNNSVSFKIYIVEKHQIIGCSLWYFYKTTLLTHHITLNFSDQVIGTPESMEISLELHKASISGKDAILFVMYILQMRTPTKPYLKIERLK